MFSVLYGDGGDCDTSHVELLNLSNCFENVPGPFQNPGLYLSGVHGAQDLKTLRFGKCFGVVISCC